jgi:hypothetical protein
MKEGRKEGIIVIKIMLGYIKRIKLYMAQQP